MLPWKEKAKSKHRLLKAELAGSRKLYQHLKQMAEENWKLREELKFKDRQISCIVDPEGVESR